ASDDLPDPDKPVMTTSLWRGMSTSMFLRLCTRTPRTAIHSWDIGNPHHIPSPCYRSRTNDYTRGSAQAFGRLLGSDVRLARLDHRIGLAARRAQRGGSRRTGLDSVVAARGRHALAARARLRRARR